MNHVSLNLNRLKDDLEGLEGGHKGNDRYVPRMKDDGYMVLRFLPISSKEGSSFFGVIRIHKVNDKFLTCHCENTTGQWVGDCPICHEYRALWKASEGKNLTMEERNAFQNKARLIKPFEKYFYNVIVRKIVKENNIETNVGPLIFDTGRKLHTKILKMICGDHTMNKAGLGDVTDVVSGRDFNYVKVSTRGADGKTYPDYMESEFLGVSQLHDNQDVINQWIDNLHDLKAERNVQPIEVLLEELRIFKGEDAPASNPMNESVNYSSPSAFTMPKSQNQTAIVNTTSVPKKEVNTITNAVVNKPMQTQPVSETINSPAEVSGLSDTDLDISMVDDNWLEGLMD